jgi:NADPH-dependent 2,4-dienoyl-CoA reductase/sulfur reductase-like enzyme
MRTSGSCPSGRRSYIPPSRRTDPHRPGPLAVVGAGVEPAVSFLDGIGIATGGGIIVDEHFRTNVPGI